jgi:hypothetical protein
MSKTINLILSAVLTGMLLNAGIASAHSDHDRGHKRGHHHKHHKHWKRHHGPRSDAKLLEPRSLPYALAANAGQVDVTFSVQLINGSDNDPQYVYLLQKDGSDDCDSRHDYCKNGHNNEHGEIFKLNDAGQNGDKIAGDNIYGATVSVNTKSHRGKGRHKGHDECLEYLAFTTVGRNKLKSPNYSLCASSFPVSIAESNTSPENLIFFADKLTSPAIANELLVRFNDNASDQQIGAAARAVGAQVAGSVLPRNLYQFQFARRLTAEQLAASIRNLRRAPGVEDAYVNQVGSFASLPEDPEYLAGGQHGYTLINADDAWALGADGTGVTIAVLDSGVAGHSDLSIAGSDTINHGTPMAGIAAAITDNPDGIAGVAGGSTLESHVVSADASVTMAEMVAGFQKVASSSTAQVVIAGFNTTLAPPGSNLAGVADQFDLCSAINDVVLNNGTPVAVVVSPAGNNNSNSNHYPSKCNDTSGAANNRLTDKNLLITVMGSVSCTSGCTPDTRQSNSNYGAWVDVAAPAVNIRGTTNAGAYGNFSGTSFAAALVGGTAAQLFSCGTTASQIQSRLTSTAPVTVAAPSGGSKPRIDSYQAVLAGNTAPTGIALEGDTSLDEGLNTIEGYTIGTLSAIDANICDAFSYNIQGGADSESFSIGGADEDQLVINAGILDFETKSSYNVTVRVTDAGGLTFDQPFTITVNDLAENTAPVVNDQVFAVDENSPGETVVGTVAASDAESPNLNFSITGGNTGEAFMIDVETGTIHVSNSQALDFETTPSFALTVEVTDGELNDTATITINLNDLEENTAPVVNDQVFAVDENSIKGTFVGTVAASDSEGDGLSFSITGGNDTGAFNINSDGAITVGNPEVLDFERTPSFALTVEVSDGALSDTATITVNLNDLVE